MAEGVVHESDGFAKKSCREILSKLFVAFIGLAVAGSFISSEQGNTVEYIGP
jgi:hypothetical protein